MALSGTALSEQEAWRLRGPAAVVSVAGALFGVAFVLLVASVVARQVWWLPAGAMAAALATLWCVQRPSRWVYLLIATIFFESSVLSLYVGGMRVRAAQVILLPAVATVALFGVAGLVRLRRVPLLLPLLLYLGCNFVSALLSASQRQSFKIFILLASLVALYVVVYTLLRDDPDAQPTAFRLFVIVGFLQVGLGLYQVGAGLANAKLGLGLPIFPKGAVHVEYLGTSWGRPYGTMPEPDTFGTVCAFYALMLGLIWLSAARPPWAGRLALLTAVAATGGLLIGFVRASWFGFLFGLAWAFQMRVMRRLRPIRPLRLTAAIGLTVAVVASAIGTSPQIRRVLARRLSIGREAGETAISRENVRFRQMRIALGLFRQRPVLGNGPGSFSVLGGLGIHEEYYFAMGADLARMYDPSLATTVLNDTGVVGALAFLLLIAAYFGHVGRRRRHIRDRARRNAALAAHCAMVGLFASFFFTHYFWLPFTWLFLAMTMLLFEQGKSET